MQHSIARRSYALACGSALACGVVLAACKNIENCEETSSCTGNTASGGAGGEGGAGDDESPSCAEDNGGCHELAACEVAEGELSCTCQDGYAGDGLDCEDIDECAEDNGGCHDDAECTNLPGSRECACADGYYGDGVDCRPLTELVSVGLDGEEGNGDSSQACLSADGRFVLFDSTASNLVEGDTNEIQDIFLRDLDMGTTTRVSVASDGSEANGWSGLLTVDSADCGLSGDGRFAVFTSSATNLVGGGSDTNEASDIFLRDLEEGTTVRVSLGIGGAEANGSSIFAQISYDGSRISFQSNASNLASDTGNWFYYRGRTGTLNHVLAVMPNGSTPSAWIGTIFMRLSMNADGTLFAFDASIPFNDADPGGDDIFLRNPAANLTTLVSYAHGDPELASDGDSSFPALSRNGRFVAFHSTATNLLPAGQDTNDSRDVYVRDLEDGSIELVSLSAISTQVPEGGSRPRISGDGRYVLFSSVSAGLVADDTNRTVDIFLRDRLEQTTIRVSVGSHGEQIAAGPSSYHYHLADDGSRVAFSKAVPLVTPQVTGTNRQIYVRTLLPRPSGD